MIDLWLGIDARACAEAPDCVGQCIIAQMNWQSIRA